MRVALFSRSAQIAPLLRPKSSRCTPKRPLEPSVSLLIRLGSSVEDVCGTFGASLPSFGVLSDSFTAFRKDQI